MSKGRTLAPALLGILLLAACSQAGTLDSALSAAKQEGKVVMLELGSVGCIACEQMKPVMSKLSETHKGRLEVIFVDVKEDPETGRRFGVYMIPVQVFLDKSGKEFHRHVGFYAYDDIAAMLKKTGI